jgi:hypothetical protein
MNDRSSPERLLSAWFESEAPTAAPADLRDDIHHATSRIRPRPAWLARLKGNHMDVIVGGARRREPRLIPLLLLVGLVLAVVAAAAFVGSQRPAENLGLVPSARPSPASPSAPAATPLTDDVTALPFSVIEIIPGDTAMWVSVGGEDTTEFARSIHRVDPATGEATLVVTDMPGRGSHHPFVEAAASLWAVDANRMLRFDAATGELLGEIPLGEFPTEPGVGFGSVWSENYRDGTLTRIDAATGEIIATIEIAQFAGEGPRSIAAGSSLFWAITPRTDVLVGIDPATNAVAQEIALATGLHCGVGVAAGRVWVDACENDYPIQVFDEATGAAIEVPADIVDIGLPVHADGNIVWVPRFDPGQPPNEMFLAAYDATTLEPVEDATVTLGTNVRYTRSGFGSLWYGIADNLYRLPLEALSTE